MERDVSEAYSAGTIFLQVVPVFKNVQDKVRRQANEIGNALGADMDKAGEEAGQKFSDGMGREVEKGGKDNAKAYHSAFQKEYDRTLSDVQKNLKPIELKAQSNDVRRQIAEIKKEVEGLSGKKIHLEADAKDAEAALRSLQAHMAALENEVKIQAKFDYRQAQAAIDKFVAKVDTLKRDLEIEIKPEVNTKQAERAMGVFETKIRESARRAANNLGDPIDRRIKEIKAELEGLSGTDIHVGLNDDVAEAKLHALAAELRDISAKSPSIQVKVDAGRAFAELYAFKKFRDKLDGDTIRERIDVGGAGGGGAFSDLSNGAGDAGNAFRTFNLVILAVVAILPAVIPLVAALGGALLALGPILAGLAGGLAAVAIGFSGIMTAVQALQARSQSASKDTQTQAKQIRAAWYSVLDARQAVADAERTFAQQAADAARAVADARRSAAEATRSALEQQQQAQEAYAKSVNDVKDAEQALRDARKQAAVDQEDLRNRIKDNKLSIRQGVLNAFTATTNLNAVMADGSSTNFDKEQAKIQHAQALQSLHELRDEQKQLAKEKKKQDKEGVNGSDAVQNAQDQLTAAIQAQQDAVQRLGDASRAVDRARADGARRVADALRQQHRTDADGRRNVARAQESLRRAQENYNETLKQTSEIGSSQDLAVKNAMAALGPAGRQFARFIFGFKKGFDNLRNDIQTVMLPPIERAIKRIVHVLGPRLHDFLVNMGKGFGKFVGEFSKSLTGPVWGRFFKMLDRLGPRFMRQFGKGIILWLEVFAQLLVIVAPWAVKLSDAMLGVANAVNHWIKSKQGVKTIQDFMAYAAKVGPGVLSFFKHLVGALVNLMHGLAPFGEVVLKGLTGFLTFLDNMNPTVLGVIATALFGIFVAIQITTGAISLMSTAASILAVEWAPMLLLFAAIAIAVAILLIYFPGVRKVLAKVLAPMVKFWKFLIKGFVDAVKHIVDFIKHNELMNKVVSRVWNALKDVGEKVFGAIVDAFHSVVDAAKWVWDHIQPIFVAIGKIVKWLWEHAVRPALSAIWGAFKFLGKVVRAVWKGFIWPILDLFIHIAIKLWQKLWVPLLKGAWKAFTHLGDIMHGVWKHVIKPVFDAFAKVANWLWDHVLHPVFKAIGDFWEFEMRGLRKVYDKWVKPMVDAFINLMGGPQGLKSKFHDVVHAISILWEGLKKVFAAPIKFVLDTVINNGLIAGFNKIADFVGSTHMADIPIPKSIMNAYATGGVLPGHFPGGDNHHFFSPTGGRLDLSGGEAIMRPEFTRAVGSGFIDSLNQAARNQGSKGVRRLLNGAAGHFFSGGGIFGRTGFANGGLMNPDQKVYMDGKAIAAIAAAQVLLAEKLRQTDYYLMQGGFGGDHIASSGTSHNYPGVADIGRAGGVTFADQAALRKVAFAAWARNIPGAALVGSGAHIHSASLLSPGTQASPQVSSDWPNYLNGLDGGPDYGPRPAVIPNIMSLLAGFDLSHIDAGGHGHHGFGLPGWLLKVARNPIGYVSGLFTKPVKALYDKFGDSGYIKEMAGVPMHLVKGVAHKVLSIIPGGAAIAHAAGFAWDKVSDVGGLIGSGIGDVVGGIADVGGSIGDVLGFKRGGVLPYNGTMMYDSGGYLPPGLTSVVNLTGQPEPVFTAEQMDRMGSGGGGWTYAPTFTKATPDPEELMDDLEFTLRKLSRAGGGRYSGARS
jgi:hypothetical protein